MILKFVAGSVQIETEMIIPDAPDDSGGSHGGSHLSASASAVVHSATVLAAQPASALSASLGVAVESVTAPEVQTGVQVVGTIGRGGPATWVPVDERGGACRYQDNSGSFSRTDWGVKGVDYTLTDNRMTCEWRRPPRAQAFSPPPLPPDSPSPPLHESCCPASITYSLDGCCRAAEENVARADCHSLLASATPHRR